MYKNILLPISLDHKGDIGRAMKLAQRLLSKDGKITLMTVIEAVPLYVAQQLPVAIIEDNIKEAEAHLKADAAGMKNVKTDVVRGHAANSILEYAQEHDMDCIVMASHRPGLQDYFIGSTTARVVAHAPISVHVVR